MPKNTDGAKSKMRSKSSRKPLGDVSNAKIALKSACISKKHSGDGGQPGDDSLDRLLLVQSDLSSLVRQIDELVVQALHLTGNKGRKEIKQFADVLSDMQTSLKPWVPRLQKALLSQSTKPEIKSEQSIGKTVVRVPEENKNVVVESPVQTKLQSLVSPSPLVSWRAECNTEGGRQLFLLTPLPQKRAFSSKCPASSIPTFENVKEEDNNNIHPAVNLHTKCGTPAKFLETNCSSMFVMTPRLKMSPPKSCVLLEPISEFAKNKSFRAHKSTPFPVRVQNSSESEDSESSSSNSQSSDDLMVKYPELFGIRINNLEKRMVEEEDSPDWMVSPPKTCVIMEPADEKLLENVSGNCSAPKKAAICNQQVEDDRVIAAKTHLQNIRDTLDLIESTPMIKEPMSSFQIGKQAGENTLKKELWTKFEAATAHVIRFDEPILEDDDTTKKGFLDRLDEALDS
ncbi:hypothetical protein PHJA_001922200 [Phtheirospermum japonicum]|uniref:Uncharacterized protein n=1 Tax=Phtheirospermum japonicum TaxID=374723 RepID=A0A830CTY8_9LAMI|nr:hypothetical protein PHJA_001922200 [Phtheirospermum japonicum]